MIRTSRGEKTGETASTDVMAAKKKWVEKYKKGRPWGKKKRFRNVFHDVRFVDGSCNRVNLQGPRKSSRKKK